MGFQHPHYQRDFQYKMNSASKLDILQNGIPPKKQHPRVFWLHLESPFYSPQKPKKKHQYVHHRISFHSQLKPPHFFSGNSDGVGSVPSLSFTKGGACSPADNKTLSGLTASQPVKQRENSDHWDAKPLSVTVEIEGLSYC